MRVPLADWRVASGSVALLVVVRGSERETTAGRQDKRPGARGGYGVVVVGFFARHTAADSAAHTANTLFFLPFCRATRPAWAFFP